MRETCEWEQDSDGAWVTECRPAYVATTFSPSDLEFEYCPFCGKVIKVILECTPDKIQFRLHAGRAQYRMWNVWIDDETNEMAARKVWRPATDQCAAGWDVEWTDWQDVPVDPSKAKVTHNASWDDDGYARRWLQGECGVDVSCAFCARTGVTERRVILEGDDYKCVRCDGLRCNFKMPPPTYTG